MITVFSSPQVIRSSFSLCSRSVYVKSRAEGGSFKPKPRFDEDRYQDDRKFDNTKPRWQGQSDERQYGGVKSYNDHSQRREFAPRNGQSQSFQPRRNDSNSRSWDSKTPANDNWSQRQFNSRPSDYNNSRPSDYKSTRSSEYNREQTNRWDDQKPQSYSGHSTPREPKRLFTPRSDKLGVDKAPEKIQSKEEITSQNEDEEDEDFGI